MGEEEEGNEHFGCLDNGENVAHNKIFPSGRNLNLKRIGACGAPSGVANCGGFAFVEMARRMSSTIYVGNLPLDVKESEIEDLFYKYGRIVDIELKLPPRPPGYCFVEFGDPQDAEDAIRGKDGYNFDGCLLRVELSHGGKRRSPFGRRGGDAGGGGRHGAPRCSDYRVIIHGLPPSASWQDLKDHMRKAGDVCFAQVFRDGNGMMGMVDYTNNEDMKYAIRKLDDSEFRNPFSKSRIRVKYYEGSPSSRSRSRSYSPRRSSSFEKNYSPRPLSRTSSVSPVKLSRSASPSR